MPEERLCLLVHHLSSDVEALAGQSLQVDLRSYAGLAQRKKRKVCSGAELRRQDKQKYRSCMEVFQVRRETCVPE